MKKAIYETRVTCNALPPTLVSCSNNFGHHCTSTCLLFFKTSLGMFVATRNRKLCKVHCTRYLRLLLKLLNIRVKVGSGVQSGVQSGVLGWHLLT